MHNQPTPSTTISPAAAIMLAVSVLAGTALAGLVVAQAVAPIHVYLGSGPLLGAVATLFGGGFLANLAVAKVMRRLDQIEARMDDHAAAIAEQGADNFASAYVAGAAGSRHLTAVPRQG